MLAACAGLLLWALQPPVAHAEPKPSYVRKVDFSSIPKQAWLAERARRIGEDLYPQVCSLLADGKTDFPRKFDIYLKRKLDDRNSGATSLTTISLDVSFLERREEDLEYFDRVLIHEMAHVAQHYNRAIIGHWLVATPHPVLTYSGRRR